MVTYIILTVSLTLSIFLNVMLVRFARRFAREMLAMQAKVRLYAMLAFAGGFLFAKLPLGRKGVANLHSE